MNTFEFFFGFYGLVLGLSLTVLATGAARVFKLRRKVRLGWLTPLLAAFVALDVTTFWGGAWSEFKDQPFSYGLLVISLAIALVYFLAATLVFPEPDDNVTDYDTHFWANKRTVLSLIILSNLLGYAASILVHWFTDERAITIFGTAVTAVPFLLLTIPAALSRRRWLVGTLIGLQVLLYVISATLLAWNPAWGDPGDTTQPSLEAGLADE